MTKLLTAIIFSFATEAYAESIYKQADCRITEPSMEVEIHAKGTPYQLNNKSKNCDNNYSFIDSGDGSLIILAGPNSDELGINAQNKVYLAPPGSRKAVDIGSIPVNADFIENKTFRDISQVGNSLFETIYTIKDREIKIAHPDHELIFSGEQCIYKNKNSKKCIPLNGTYENPICARQSGEKKVLAKKEKCSDLIENINSRLGK